MTHFASSPSFTSLWNRRIKLLGSAALLSLAPTLAAQAADPAGTIGSKGGLGFRGDGTSASVSNAPATLDVGDQGNVGWRQAMPGRSVAGPIVVGDLVVTTSSSGQDGEVLHVSGGDLQTGDVQWEQTFRATGRPFCHPTSANAAPSISPAAISIAV